MGRVLPFTGQETDPGVLLDVDNVTLQYKTESRLVTATYQVDFQVHRGDRFVLLGPSGCGKSTPAEGRRPASSRRSKARSG